MKNRLMLIKLVLKAWPISQSFYKVGTWLFICECVHAPTYMRDFFFNPFNPNNNLAGNYYYPHYSHVETEAKRWS